MLSSGGSPKASGVVFRYHDISIIEYYKEKALCFLNYYKPAVNYHEIKKLVDYHFRWSLLHTLAGKYKSKVRETIKKYGKTPKVVMRDDKKELILASFLTPNEINHRNKGFFTAFDPFFEFENIDRPIVKLFIPKALFFKKCAIIGCLNKDIKVYHVKVLTRVRKGFTIGSIKSNGKTLKESVMIESALNRKQIPLCKVHYANWHNLEKN